MKRNGIIPLIYKRIICILWKGHDDQILKLNDSLQWLNT